MKNCIKYRFGNLFCISALLYVLLNACATMDVIRVAPNPNSSFELDSLFIVTAGEFDSTTATLRARVHLSDQSLALSGWNGVREKLKEKAQLENANILLVDYIKAGNGTVLSGRFYNSPDYFPEDDTSCGFVLYRTGESILGTAFDIRVKIENKVNRLLLNKEFITYQGNGCDQPIPVGLNGKTVPVLSENPKKIWMIYKETSGSAVGTSMSIGIGGVGIQLLPDQELFMLEYKVKNKL